jgi:hypothetical protein
MVTKNLKLSDVKPAGPKRRHVSGVIVNRKAPVDYQAEAMRELQEAEGRRVVIFDPAMLTPKGCSNFRDPVTGEKVTARMQEVRWLEMRRDVEGKGSKARVVEAFRPVRLDRVDVPAYFKKVEALHEGLREAMRETTGSYDDWGQLSAGLSSGEYLPMPPGPYTRQLYVSDMWAMHAKAFEAYNHNPVAKALVDMKAAFIIGGGVMVKCADELAQDVADEFIERERLNERLHTWCRMRIVNGELFIQPAEVKPGYLGVRSVDPSTVWEIVTNPRDIAEVYGYWVQYSTQYQIKTEKAAGGSAPVSEYVIELLPPDAVLHLVANVQENEKRGRSDLYPVLGWLKWLKDFYQYKVVRAVGEAAWLWDHKVKGDDTDVRRIAEQFTTWPQPGSEYFHNEAEERTLVAFNGAAAGQRSPIGDEILNLVCVGMGIPKEYMGIGDASTRANAITATEPAAKVFQTEQKRFEGLLRDILRRVLSTAQQAGRLAAGADLSFEVVFPEIAPENKKEKVELLDQARRMGVFTKERVASMVAKELDVTDYDYEKEQTDIAAEEAADREKAGAFLYPPVPGADELDQDPEAASKVPDVLRKPKRPTTGGTGNAERRAVNKTGATL